MVLLTLKKQHYEKKFLIQLYRSIDMYSTFLEDIGCETTLKSKFESLTKYISISTYMIFIFPEACLDVEQPQKKYVASPFYVYHK